MTQTSHPALTATVPHPRHLALPTLLASVQDGVWPPTQGSYLPRSGQAGFHHQISFPETHNRSVFPGQSQILSRDP